MRERTECIGGLKGPGTEPISRIVLYGSEYYIYFRVSCVTPESKQVLFTYFLLISLADRENELHCPKKKKKKLGAGGRQKGSGLGQVGIWSKEDDSRSFAGALYRSSKVCGHLSSAEPGPGQATL